jgi:ubiquinone/menaquinone biosynthesis C-methylase UbiE
MAVQLKSFDRVADRYDATRAMPPAAGAAVAAGIAGALRAVAANPMLLEVGIGTGRIAVPLADAGVAVAGVDIAPAMLARLRAKRVDIPAVLAEAASLPFRRRRFTAHCSSTCCTCCPTRARLCVPRTRSSVPGACCCMAARITPRARGAG